jgi:hypothetical protein
MRVSSLCRTAGTPTQECISCSVKLTVTRKDSKTRSLHLMPWLASYALLVFFFHFRSRGKRSPRTAKISLLCRQYQPVRLLVRGVAYYVLVQNWDSHVRLHPWSFAGVLPSRSPMLSPRDAVTSKRRSSTEHRGASLRKNLISLASPVVFLFARSSKSACWMGRERNGWRGDDLLPEQAPAELIIYTSSCDE